MISGFGGLEHSWSEKAREWGFADPEEVLMVTLSEALHSYRDYLLELAGAAKAIGGDVAEPDAPLDVFLRLSASAADGLWPARRDLLWGTKSVHSSILGFDLMGAVHPQSRADQSPWLKPEAYRLARAAVSFQMSLAGDPSDDEHARLEHEGSLHQDSILLALMLALNNAESRLLHTAETADETSSPGSQLSSGL